MITQNNKKVKGFLKKYTKISPFYAKRCWESEKRNTKKNRFGVDVAKTEFFVESIYNKNGRPRSPVGEHFDVCGKFFIVDWQEFLPNIAMLFFPQSHLLPIGWSEQ